MAADLRFQNAVTFADADGVPIRVVLDETSVFYAAARRARLQVSNDRAQQAR